jgi:inner membrane protein
MFGAKPVPTFLIMYAIIVCYYILRFAVQAAVKNTVKRTIPNAKQIIVAPTMKFFQWRVAANSETHHYVGRAYGRSITIYDKFERIPLPDSKLVKVALEDRNLSAFISFSPIYRWEVKKLDHLYEVRLIDLRYRSNDYYPFVAVAHLNEELEIVNSYTGWIFSEDKLRKKLDFMPN